MRRLTTNGAGIVVLLIVGVSWAGPAPAVLPKNATAYSVANTTGKTANDLKLTYNKAPTIGTSHTFSDAAPGVPDANSITFGGTGTGTVPAGTMDYGTVSFGKAKGPYTLQKAAWSFPPNMGKPVADIPIKLAALGVDVFQLNGHAFVSLANLDPTDPISITNFQASDDIPDSDVLANASGTDVDTTALTGEPIDASGAPEMDQQFAEAGHGFMNPFVISPTLLPLESLNIDLGPVDPTIVSDVAVTLDATDTVTGASEGIGALSNAVAPAPSAAWGGLALLGVVALVQYFRPRLASRGI